MRAQLLLCLLNLVKHFCKGQFPVSGISRAGGILDNEMLLSRNNLFNFRATFSLVNKRISARSENSTDWKLALRPFSYSERESESNDILIDFAEFSKAALLFGILRTDDFTRDVGSHFTQCMI